ncbi:MAG: hypothetical protein ABEI53_02165 [Candidatus Magasanikbacteria bacterium]
MKDKIKKGVVFFLAILMVFAFSPFLFLSPNSQTSPQQNSPSSKQKRDKQVDPNNYNKSSTSTNRKTNSQDVY